MALIQGVITLGTGPTSGEDIEHFLLLGLNSSVFVQNRGNVGTGFAHVSFQPVVMDGVQNVGLPAIPHIEVITHVPNEVVR